jgi:outer membrane protein TolC
MKKILILFILFVSLFGASKESENVNVNLQRLVQEVVKRNSDAVKVYLQSSIAKEQLSYERGIYDPIVSANIMRSSTDVPNSVENELVRLQQTYQDTTDSFESEVSGLFSTGATWSVIFSNNKKQSSIIDANKDYDAEHDSTIKLTLEQPLLKDAGQSIAEAKIKLADFEQDIAYNSYKQKLMELQGITIELYWRLYGAQKIYESWKKSVEIAKRDYQNIEYMAKSGKVARSEVLEAKSALNFKKGEFENAKNKYNSVINQIMTLLDISYQKSGYTFTTDKEPNEESLNLIKADEYIESALKQWPEYINAKKNFQKAKLQKEYAYNQTLPQLNLLGGVEKTTLETNTIDSVSELYDGDFVSWHVGVSYSRPLFNDQAKSSLKISNLKLLQAQKELNKLEKSLKNSIMIKIDNLQSAKEQYVLYKNSLDIKEQLLNIEHDKMELGKSNMKQVLEKEEDFINVQRKYLSAIINWKTSEAILEIAAGNLLQKYNIDIDTLHTLDDAKDAKESDIKDIF